MSNKPVPQLGEPTFMVRPIIWRNGGVTAGERSIPQETAIAFVIDGGAEAVMMASPVDLEDFASGFLLNEALISSLSDIRDLEIIEVEKGVELRVWLHEPVRKALIERRRFRVGPTGCGLCGVESLDQALRATPSLSSNVVFTPDELTRAMRDLHGLQAVNLRTHAMHAAAFYQTEGGITCVREDVGRHNALDKLAGAMSRRECDAANGAILMTSRVSVELIQKAARMGAPVLAAVSAPTALALRVANEAGICVVGVVRGDGLEVFTHPQRLGYADGHFNQAMSNEG